MTHMKDDPRLTPARTDLAAAHLRGQHKAARYAEGIAHIVVSSVTALRGEPHCASAQLTELLHGERFIVYEDRGGWVWGQAELDGYVGYAERSAFGPEGGPTPDHVVASLFAHLYSAPAGRSATTALLPMMSRLALADSSPCGRFRRVAGSGEFIFARHVHPLAAPETDHVAVAERLIGAPYLWGGRTAAGIDCSGLVQLSLLACGRTIPRDSDQQLAALRHGLGRPVAPEAATRGDIAFFPGHVGILLGAGTILHANATHMAVTVDPLETVLERIGREHSAPLSGIYRLTEPSDSV